MSGLSEADREALCTGRCLRFPDEPVRHSEGCAWHLTVVKAFVDREVAAALTAAADEMEAVAAEHLAHDEAEKCKARYCQGWRRGQQHAARIIRARIT